MVESVPFRHWNEQDFLGFLVDYIVDVNPGPGDMQTNLDKISKHMLTLPPKCPANLYRK